MNKSTILSEALASYSPQQLEVSRRGSGLNAVWKIDINGKPAVLKTYSSRRGPIKTFLSNIEHFLSGRTPYTPSARYHTERENLRLWKKAGFDVPDIMEHHFDPEIPLPHLCLEYVEGSLLSSHLANTSILDKEKNNVFREFVEQWANRHQAAAQSSNPRLIQEHATLDHVIFSHDRFVTLDLEVSYKRQNIKALIAHEICGYMKPLFKRLPDKEADHFLELLVKHYPHRQYLEAIYTELLENPNPLVRLIHFLDRRLKKRGKTATKFEVARRLNAKLGHT
ncbi:hypothetical protein ACFLS1_03820 [Verrucomicrobiota bacterium]